MAFVVGALGCALNVALYVGAGHHWWSLASGIFCGFIAIGGLMQEMQ